MSGLPIRLSALLLALSAPASSVRLAHGHPTRLGGLRLLSTITVCMLLAGCATSRAPAGDPGSDALLDRIWPRTSAPIRVLSKQDQTYAEAALTQWLDAYLHHAFDVVDSRFHWSRMNSSEWVAISQGHASRIAGGGSQWRGTEIEQPWQSPGLDLARLWKVCVEGTARYFAIAMTDQPVPGTQGRRLIGRYELKRTDTPESNCAR